MSTAYAFAAHKSVDAAHKFVGLEFETIDLQALRMRLKAWCQTSAQHDCAESTTSPSLASIARIMAAVAASLSV